MPPSEQQCPVCCESLISSPSAAIGVTTCGHCFHRHCYEAWSSYSNSSHTPNGSNPSLRISSATSNRTKCPTCNTRVKKFVPVYLNLSPIDGIACADVDATKENGVVTDYKMMAAVASKKCEVTLQENLVLRAHLAKARMASTEHMLVVNQHELLRRNFCRSERRHSIQLRALQKEIKECRTKLVTQTFERVGPFSDDKLQILLKHCRYPFNHHGNQPPVLVFTTETNCDKLAESLRQSGLSNVSVLHQHQNRREYQTTLRKVRTGCIDVLVISDVAAASAQGIDFMGTSKVINVNMPDTVDEYRNRCSFAKSTGTMVSFIDEGDVGIMRELLDHLKATKQDTPQWLQQMYSKGSYGLLKDYGTSSQKDDDVNSSKFTQNCDLEAANSRDINNDRLHPFDALFFHESPLDQDHNCLKDNKTEVHDGGSNEQAVQCFSSAHHTSPFGAKKKKLSSRQLEQVAQASNIDRDSSIVAREIDISDEHANQSKSKCERDPSNNSDYILLRSLSSDLTVQPSNSSAYRGESDIIFINTNVTDRIGVSLKDIGVKDNHVQVSNHMSYHSDSNSSEDDKSNDAHDSIGEKSFYDDEEYCYYTDYST